jgi:outer membrane protein assembly factor BamE
MYLFPPVRDRHINICTLVICLLLTTLGGCTRNYDGGYNIPFVYKLDIQQGNVVDQNMIDKLQKGMDKTRVRFIMGTPVLADPFHSNRWEYIFSYQEGGKKREQRHISLHFEDEKLAYIEGDVETTRLQRPSEGLKEGKSIVVPSSYGKKKGFFGRMTDKVNPWSDETPQDEESESVNVEPQIEDEADSQIEQQEDTLPEAEYESVYAEPQDEDGADSQIEQEDEDEKKGFFSRMFGKKSPESEATPQQTEPASVNLEQIEDEADSQIEQLEETSPEPEDESVYVEPQGEDEDVNQIEQEDEGKKKGFFSRQFDAMSPGTEESPQDAEPESINVEPQIEDDTDSQIEPLEETPPEPEDEGKKKGFFSRLFGKNTPGSEEAPQDTEPASVNE